MKKLTILITLLWTASFAFAAQDPAAPSPSEVTAVPSEERDKALIQSAFDGDLAKVQALLKKGASVDATAPKNRTALIWAATNGHTAVVQALCDAGANVNVQDGDGHTALMFAVKGSHLATAEFLLENGADVNIQSKKQRISALIVAAAIGNIEVVQLLLDHGADTDLAEIDGSTALDRARQYGHPAVVALLESTSDSASNS